MTLRKLKTDGFIEQTLPGKCPECDFDMIFDTEIDYCIGYGEYPKGGYRSQLKPNALNCLIYECPNCFIKSVHHITPENLKVKIELSEEMEIFNKGRDK